MVVADRSTVRLLLQVHSIFVSFFFFNDFKRPPMILGGPSGDSRARTMQVL